MWNYDKLFAEGNVIGLKNIQTNFIMPTSVYAKENWGRVGQVNWYDYLNEDLSYYSTTEYDFEIQYIIRLDEHGNIVEKLFDRERDMPQPMPELKTGMFVRVIDNENMTHTVLGYVDVQNCRVVYQDGTYNDLTLLSTKKCRGIVDIVEVYSNKTLCFKGCLSNETLIWRSLEYQAYLDSITN